MSSFPLMIALALAAVSPSAAPSPSTDRIEDPAPAVGFRRLAMPDGTAVGVWYPASGRPVPRREGLYAQLVVPDAPLPPGRHALVVISHGTGGDLAGHLDTAAALARAGFVVAALTHPGDNWRDRSRATAIDERPRALSALVTFMVDRWDGRDRIDPTRIGAFGFSAGGYTVLAAAGGRADLSRIGPYCARRPDSFVCALVREQPRTGIPSAPPAPDRRLRALVVAAPALGFAFDRAGLRGVTVPVQLWRADDDRILPAPDYADAVRAALPRAPEFHAVPGAGHFDFLAPCAEPAAMPTLCASAAGFDRAAFHRRFNAAVVRFFTAALAERGARGRIAPGWTPTDSTSSPAAPDRASRR